MSALPSSLLIRHASIVHRMAQKSSIDGNIQDVGMCLNMYTWSRQPRAGLETSIARDVLGLRAWGCTGHREGPCATSF